MRFVAVVDSALGSPVIGLIAVEGDAAPDNDYAIDKAISDACRKFGEENGKSLRNIEDLIPLLPFAAITVECLQVETPD